MSFIVGSLLLIFLQLFFHFYVSKEHLSDEVNLILMETFTLPELSVIFLFGAFTEETLFRGILQPYLGIWITTALFTVIHFRYLKKFFLLVEVFLMGIILGVIFLLTQTIWVSLFCHLTVNILTAGMIKKGYIQY
jgi:membrane protease YdiL (CAAX protease family)